MTSESSPAPTLSAEREAWLARGFAGRAKDEISETLVRIRTSAGLLRSYTAKPAGSANKTAFILFGLMRSGTTVLGDLLARHPDLTWLGEAYIQEAYFPARYLNAVSRSCPTPCVGLKAFSFQLSVQRNPFIPYGRSDIARGRRILARLRDDGWRFMHLTRNDTFAQAVSLTRASQSGSWHRIAGDGGNSDRVRLDLLEFKLHLEFLKKCHRYEAEIFPGVDMLELNYEADLIDPAGHQAAADKVFGYLGLRPASVSSKMVRLAGERLEAQVENFDELTRAAASLGVSATS
jgi:LPS sulfotransferase NodH